MRPNLVIVFPDQMRGQALGFLNEDPVHTPNLDRFAAESLVFPQAVSNYPVCSPYRAMLMTGKYSHANKVISNCTSNSEPFGSELQKSDVCWSDVLKQQGYSLGYIGKWHLDSPREPYIDCYNNKGDTKWNDWCSPDRRHGFDYWYSYGTYDRHMKPMYWDNDAKRDEYHFVDQWGPEHEADKAIAYIENQGGRLRDPDKPFALVVSMNPPHGGNFYPEKYRGPYEGKSDADLLVRPNVDKSGKTKMSKYALSQIRHYFAMITGVDEQFGRILDSLEKAGIKDNTIVLFTADHGNCVGTHDLQTKNNQFEESMRIPFILRWPEKITPRHDDLLISVPDVYPTLLDMMGLKDQLPDSLEGESLADVVLTGEGRRPSSQLYLKIRYDSAAHGRRGVRTLSHKLVYKLIPGGSLETELSDLRKDPYERKNVAADKAEIVAALTEKELVPWLKKTNDPWLRHISNDED